MDIPSVETNGDRRRRPISGIQYRSRGTDHTDLVAKIVFEAIGNAVQLSPYRPRGQPLLKRQDIGKQAARQTIGHERRPFGLEIDQLRRRPVGE